MPHYTSEDEPPMNIYRVKYPTRARCPPLQDSKRVQSDNRIFILTSCCTELWRRRTFCFRTMVDDAYTWCYSPDPFKRVTLKRPEKKNPRFSYDRTPKRVWAVGSFFFFIGSVVRSGLTWSKRSQMSHTRISRWNTIR